jgi:hypothetical protein
MKKSKKIISLLVVIMIFASTLIMPISTSKAGEVCNHPSTYTTPLQYLYGEYSKHYVDGTNILCEIATRYYMVGVYCQQCGACLDQHVESATYHSIPHL